MGPERRGRAVHGRLEVNPSGEEPTDRLRQKNAGLWEPYDGRLSRTVLREREGEVPSRHSPGSVLVGEGWSVVQAVQHCELVTQHDDLEVLRASRANSQAGQRHEQPVQNATHRTPGCRRIMPGQRTRPHSWAPTRVLGIHTGGWSSHQENLDHATRIRVITERDFA